MRSKRSIAMWILAAVLVISFSFSALNFIFARQPAYTYADDPVVVGDTEEFVKTSVNPDNAVVLTANEGGGIIASGNQTNDRTVVVFDHAYTLGSKINFTIKIDADVTDTGNSDTLKGKVYSAIYFAQATKTENGFSASDFFFNRSSGNGMRLHLFTNDGDLKPQNRAMINIGTFTKKDIVNGDSVYSGLGDGANDLGWAFTNAKPIDIEIGVEKVGGIDKIYIQFTVDRRPARPNLTVYKVSIDQSDLIDTENSDGYYIAFEAANSDATERAVSAEISAITVTEAALLVTPESVFLKPTQTANLTVKNTLTQQVISEGLTFTSDNAGVATVDGEGKITAVKAGSAKITVSHTDIGTGEAYVTVADSVTLNSSAIELVTGQTTTLVATTNPTGLNVIWESDNTEVVTVNNGMIKALTVGTANIKATIKNFESGDLEISATAQITVREYVKPDDIHGEDFDVVYSDGIIIGGNGYSYDSGTYYYNGTVQAGYSYLVISDDMTFDKPISFDFINAYDVSNTDDANHMKRFFGISIVQGSAAELEAADYALDAPHGLQINFSSNGGWWSWGGKFFMNYKTSVSGTVSSLRTPENTGSLTGTDRFANAFCRAFADGMRIHVKIWKDGSELKVSFTPVFVEGTILDGSENLKYPNGGDYDFVGPYTMIFNYNEVATGEGNFAIAIGTGNTIEGTVANMNYSINNFDNGLLMGLKLDVESLMLKKGDKYVVKPIYNPSTYNVLEQEWTSSDQSVATVDDKGEITAVKAGTATITYTADGKSATCTVTVIESLSVNSHKITLEIGKTYKIEATTNPEGVEIIYASGNNNYATVSQDGVITAVAEGEVIIYVRAGGDLFTEEITVTVTKAKGGCSSNLASSGTAIILGTVLLSAILFLSIKRKNKN